MHEDVPQGLTTQKVEEIRSRVGANRLPEARGPGVLSRFTNQFKNPLIYLLLAAIVVDLLLFVREGHGGIPVDAVAIGAILLLNAVLGVWQEQKAEAALSALKKMAAPVVWVRRDGHFTRIPAEALVPGDLVRLEAGDRIPADGDLVFARGVKIDRSIVTGESVPEEAAEGESIQSGTLLAAGEARMVVTAIGEESALGQLASLLGQIKEEKTPLEVRMAHFGKRMAQAVGIIALAVVAVGYLVAGTESLSLVFVFAVALAVAAVPEGLPAALSLTLALGTTRMAKKKAVVRHLAAVEALGSITIIATDKTGTLTENQMTVRRVDVADKADPQEALIAMVLASDAEVEGAGDPMETALYRHAESSGLNVENLRLENPRVDERPFDSAWRFLRATVHKDGGELSYLKGAPEEILARSALSEDARGNWNERVEQAANEGLRTLALAKSRGRLEDAVDFLGLVMLWDPPRPEVPDAVAAAQSAGIRVVMITGDHPTTARAVARAVNMPDGGTLTGSEVGAFSDDALRRKLRRVNLCARVQPATKLRIVEALRADHHWVAVTGDGVNDAPALKAADVGVAMGKRGSEVAREVSDLVLLDDNFATIVAAIRSGRSIYENIQKFIRFLFATNLAELALLVGGFAMGLFALGAQGAAALVLPLTAAQILWINLVTDSLPALSLAFDQNDGLMERGPRAPRAPLLDPPSLIFILWVGAAQGGICLALLAWAPLALGPDASIAPVLLTVLTLGQLFFIFPARRLAARPLLNKWLFGALAVVVLLSLLALYLPPLAGLLHLAPLSGAALALTAGALAASAFFAALTQIFYVIKAPSRGVEEW
jgi:Ca2+-transporting ATPase